MTPASCMPPSIRVRSKSSVPDSAGTALACLSRNSRFIGRLETRESRIKLMFLTHGGQRGHKNGLKGQDVNGYQQEIRQMAQAHPGGAWRAGPFRLPGNLRTADLHRRLCL